MVSSRIHDFSIAENAGIPTALLLLLDHLSENQEAELPPTHGCLSLILLLLLLLPEPEPESGNPVLLMLQEHPSFHYYWNSTPWARTHIQLLLLLLSHYQRLHSEEVKKNWLLPSTSFSVFPPVSPRSRTLLETSLLGSLGNVICSLLTLYREEQGEWAWSWEPADK